MKITVGQFKVKSKAIKDNYYQMHSLIEAAIKNNYEIIVFGEYVLTGYGCEDLFKNHDFINEVVYYQNKIKSLASKITIIFGGLIYQDKKLYNTAIIYNKDDVYYSFKNNLNKREFAENNYFTSQENKVITLNNKDYLITFRQDLQMIDKYHFDILVVLDSSPVNDLVTVDLSKVVVYANTIGVTAVEKVVFINGGNSFIKVNNKLFAFNGALFEGIIDQEHQISRVAMLKALTNAIKVWSDQTFGKNKKWIVGSSGGLDSAVTTALLVIALGSENVITYNLASKYNKDLTINNATKLAKILKIQHLEGNIQALVDQTYTSLSDFGYTNISSFDQENIQARTRGNLLSAFSALENAVVSNNANKLELVLGYTTMYGDTIGALSLIGDLNKVEVIELAKEINTYFNQQVILKNLLPTVENYKITWEMPPSAELKIDQVDPMKWFYHDLLLELILTYSAEEILEKYLVNQFKGLEIANWLSFYDLLDGKNFIDDFNWFNRTMQINHFKRLQTPPILAFSNKVLGVDYKESSNLLPKSKRHLRLEAKIIEKY